LLAVVDLRLAFMPAVAAAKEGAGRPLRDPQQEDAVLAAVQTQAREHGLVPEPVVGFFRAQIAAAAAVQRVFAALPRNARPFVDALDLERDARPAIAALSEQIVARAADVAANPDALARVKPSQMSDALDVSLIPQTNRDAIAATIVALRRTP
jgi:chorismate mutase-like protein